MSGLTEGATYHFVATAYNASGSESGFSNDIAATVAYSVPVAQFSGSPTSGNYPLTINFSNTSSGTITTYAWTFGDGGTSTASAPSHVYAAAGSYTVSLTVVGPGGSNTQIRTNYISVTAPPPPPVAQFTGSPTSGRAPLTVAFTNTSTGSITSYPGPSVTVAPAQSPARATYSAEFLLVSLTVTARAGARRKPRPTTSVGRPDVGLFRAAPGATKPPYRFLLDYNFDHTPDAQVHYGAVGDMPLVGNMSPGGKTSFIMYRNGIWSIDTNRDGTTDAVAAFGGLPGDIPLTGNFTGPGQLDDIVIYRKGTWFVDRDLSGTADATYMFGGVAGDVPLAGDVNGDGIADLVIYRNGMWYIDTNRNGTADMIVGFGGLPQDVPALFDWDGDGKADLCIFRNGDWYISTKRTASPT